MNYSNYFIRENESLRKALMKINAVPGELTLFVTDSKSCIIGSLTDGDIRRSLLKEISVNDPVKMAMFTDFIYFTENNIDVDVLRQIRMKNIRLIPVLNSEKKIVKLLFLKDLMSYLPVTAFIMAGGTGKRLKPLTDEVPKPMLEIGGKPLILNMIDRLKKYGIEEIFISVNYLKDKIKNFLGNGEKFDVKIQYIEENSPLGTIGSVSLVKNFSHRNLLLLNADLITNIDFEELYLEHVRSDAALTIASIPYTVDIPYAILERKGKEVLAIKEKPKNTHYANAGIYMIDREAIGLIPYNMPFNATDLIEKLIVLNKKVVHNPITGYWIDIGNPDDYIKAKEFYSHLH